MGGRTDIDRVDYERPEVARPRTLSRRTVCRILPPTRSGIGSSLFQLVPLPFDVLLRLTAFEGGTIWIQFAQTRPAPSGSLARNAEAPDTSWLNLAEIASLRSSLFYSLPNGASVNQERELIACLTLHGHQNRSLQMQAFPSRGIHEEHKR
jgi:hypothetical protein